MTSDPSGRRKTANSNPEPRLPAAAGVFFGLAVLGMPAMALAILASNPPAGASGHGTTTALAFVAAIALIVLLNGLFVMAETALSFLKQPMVKAYEGDARVQGRLEHLISRKESYLAGVYMGSQTMRAWLILLCPLLAWSIVDATNGGAAPDLMTVAAWMVGVSIPIAGLNILFGELAPKSVAAVRAVPTAVSLYGFIRLFSSLFGIPSRVAIWVAEMITKRFGAHAAFDVQSRAEEEIKHLIDSYEESGQIEEEQAEMIDNIFEFSSTLAKEVMTPRVDLDAINADATLKDAAAMIHDTGHSRLPVFEDTDDQIIGIVHAKDIMKGLVEGQGDRRLRQWRLREAVFVPESKEVQELLEEMRRRKAQMVIVQDEYGGTSGVVTIEDIVEEVMGEIVDEYDREELPILKNGRGYLVLGKLHLEDVNDEIGTDFASEEFDTIGGYVFGLFGRQPDQGETIKDGEYVFTIEETDGRRIVRLRVEESSGSDSVVVI